MRKCHVIDRNYLSGIQFQGSRWTRSKLERRVGWHLAGNRCCRFCRKRKGFRGGGIYLEGKGGEGRGKERGNEKAKKADRARCTHRSQHFIGSNVGGRREVRLCRVYGLDMMMATLGRERESHLLLLLLLLAKQSDTRKISEGACMAVQMWGKKRTAMHEPPSGVRTSFLTPPRCKPNEPTVVQDGNG